ncbi:MAG: hypothetical protein M1836_004867 [Candelina mexicana]|nr:MAG: hypothetical protein M1836_004867 [Candelina mexicana]
MKELYACGFNGHNQLRIGPLPLEAPEDLHSFQKIVAGNDIAVKYTGWSTVCKIRNQKRLREMLTTSLGVVDAELILLGPLCSSSLDGSTTSWDAALGLHQKDAIAFFGDHRGILGLLASDGQIQATSGHRPKQLVINNDSKSELKIRHIAIAGNEKVVAYCSQKHSDHALSPTILEFPSFQALLDWKVNLSNPSFSQLLLPPELANVSIVTLLSNFTSFTLLTTSGNVYTWGDPRHFSLGRNPTSSSPATAPHLVDFLGGIPIRKIASGGWITAALSYENDLYLWGGRPGEKHRIKDLPDLPRQGIDEAEVKLVDIDGGVDIVDVGVGDGHVVVLCRDGRVFAVGRGENGQLGVGVRKFEEEWMEIRLDLGERKRVVGVYGGAWSSFLMVEGMRN